MTFVKPDLGTNISPIQSIHSQRIPHNAAVKALLGIDILVDQRDGEC